MENISAGESIPGRGDLRPAMPSHPGSVTCASTLAFRSSQPKLGLSQSIHRNASHIRRKAVRVIET